MYPNTPQEDLTIVTIHCPKLIEGIIVMHQFSFINDINDSHDAKKAVMRYLALNLGMDYPSDAEAEAMEIFTHNSGATFSPEDTFTFLNLVYSAYREIVFIDCTLESIIVGGTWDYESNLTVQDLQEVATRDFERTATDPRFMPSYGGFTNRGY